MTDDQLILGFIGLLITVLLIYILTVSLNCESMTVMPASPLDINEAAEAAEAGARSASLGFASPAAESENLVADALKQKIVVLKMSSGPPKLIYLLQDFAKWLDKNPEEKAGLDKFPSIVVNTYFRDASPDNPLKFVKTNTNANILTDAVNKIYGEVYNTNASHRECYQNYNPKYLQEFDAWLDDDFPRRKRFDIAMKGVNNMPTRITVAQIINEFVSTNQIPASEAKDLRKNVLNYLQLSTTIPNYQQNYNTTPFDRFRIILKNLAPDTPLLIKFKHFQDIYKNDPLGVELNNYFIWLNKNNLITESEDPQKLQEHLKKTIDQYPQRTDLLEKAIIQQFITNLNIVKNK